jgi:hypothetical protein
MKTLKNLNLILNDGSKIIIVAVLALAGLITSFSGQNRLFDYFAQFLPLLLFGLVAIYAQFKGYSLLSFTILLLIFYPSSISNFTDASLQLIGGRFTFTFEIFIHFWIGIFLLAMILSILLSGLTIKPKLSNVDLLFLAAGFIHIFVFNNMIASINSLLLIIIALMLGSRKLASLLFVIKYLMTPLNYVDNLFRYDTLSLALHIRSITGIIVLCILIVYLTKIFSDSSIE